MKNLFFYLLIISTLVSCNKNNEDVEVIAEVATTTVDNYRLIEILADPGDGSGIFQNVESEKIISFYNDGTITSNGELCFMGVESNSPSTGTYSIIDSTISTSNCTNLNFEISGNELIINYPCFEPCRAKFLKQS
jgi:hypothetical protein